RALRIANRPAAGGRHLTRGPAPVQAAGNLLASPGDSQRLLPRRRTGVRCRVRCTGSSGRRLPPRSTRRTRFFIHCRSFLMFEPQRLKHILSLGLPIIGGMLSQSLLNLIDAAMVGHLGEKALAGVGIGSYANFMAIA